MNINLKTYLRDHLAGARFAKGLLADLQEQSVSSEAAEKARSLLLEINEDAEALERVIAKLGAETSTLKEFSAWMAQKASYLKFSVNDHFGIFEAIEFMSLGVLGKRALWRALSTVARIEGVVDRDELDLLISRAESQYKLLEELRLKLAAEVLEVEPATNETGG